MLPCPKQVVISECITIGLIYCKKSATEHTLLRDSEGSVWVLCEGNFPCIYNPRIHFKYD